MAIVQGAVSLATTLTETKSTGIPGGVTISYQVGQNLGSTNYANGTIANQLDLIYTGTLSLAAAPQTIDLTSLTSQFGAAINFARVCEFIYFNHGTDGQIVTMGAAASNPWTGAWGSTVILFPGAPGRIPAPLLTGIVTAGGSKAIKFDPGANTISLDLYIAGRSV
jgi:hypothetical protein